MWLNLSKNEILTLEALCKDSQSPGELAGKLGKKGSFVSRVLGKLDEKGLIARERREIKLSPASHAQNFKILFDSRPNAKIEDWLRGNAMDVLILMTNSLEGTEFNLIEEKADCSKPTLYKVLKLLYSAGVIAKEGKTIQITDRVLGQFIGAYAENLQLRILSEVRGYNVSIRVRKHVILRTDAPNVPDFFSETGINALAKMGLEANLTSYKDLYFNLDRVKRTPGAEEAFIHALRLTTLQQHQDKPLLALFMAKNAGKLDVGKLRRLGKEYLVEGDLDVLRNAVGYFQQSG